MRNEDCFILHQLASILTPELAAIREPGIGELTSDSTCHFQNPRSNSLASSPAGLTSDSHVALKHERKKQSAGQLCMGSRVRVFGVSTVC